jgi:hypothetical protein
LSGAPAGGDEDRRLNSRVRRRFLQNEGAWTAIQFDL